MKIKTFRRTLSVVAFAAVLLTMTACSGDDAGPSSRASGVSYSGFVGEHDEVIALGTSEHLVRGAVADIKSIPDSFGRSQLTLEIANVDWQTDLRWNIGTEEPVAPLKPGDVVDVLVDDAWLLATGDQIAAAISMVPVGEQDGYVRMVLGTDALRDAPAAGEDVGGGLGPDAIRRFVATAADLRGVDVATDSADEPQIGLMKDLVLASRGWIDAINLAEPGSLEPPLEGLLAEVYAVLDGTADSAPPNASSPLDALLDIPAELRQLPVHPENLAELSSVLGVHLEPIEGAVFDDTNTYRHFALRFVDVGVLGPWNTDRELSYGRLRGVGPLTGDVEVLGWTQDDPAPESEVVVGRLTLPDGWAPSTHALVVNVSAGGEVSVDTVEHIELVRRIDELLQQRPTE